MLCYLRYPGRPLRKPGERHCRQELTAFVAEQIDAPPTAIEAYLAAERNLGNDMLLKCRGAASAAVVPLWETRRGGARRRPSSARL